MKVSQKLEMEKSSPYFVLLRTHTILLEYHANLAYWPGDFDFFESDPRPLFWVCRNMWRFLQKNNDTIYIARVSVLCNFEKGVGICYTLLFI